MNKKIISVVVALVLLVSAVLLYNWYQDGQGDDTGKVVYVTIVDAENNTLYDGKTITNVAKLGELLIEMHESEEIMLDYDTVEYGMYIKGMGKEEIVSEDKVNNLFWVYDSENNAQCLANDFCDGVDILVIEDQDEFVFTLTSFE